MPSGFVTLTPVRERSSCNITLRLFSIVRRRFSTTLCKPFNAPSAAACKNGEVHEVICPWTFVMISTSLRGAIAQPMRKPVIP